MISQQPNVAIREKLIGKLMEAPNTAVGVAVFTSNSSYRNTSHLSGIIS